MSPASAQKPALTLTVYADRAQQTDRFADDPRALERLRFGYFGEIGGLLAAVKKVARDQLQTTETEAAAATNLPAAPSPAAVAVPPSSASPVAAEPADEPAKPSEGAEVVRLDRFRKK